MAERRMFAKTIVTSDTFLDMSASARCLYFTLSMFADDDGFVNNPKSIMRQSGSNENDLTELISKKYVLGFNDGVLVITHWRIHNYIRNDRYTETKYVDIKKKLYLDENKAYTGNKKAAKYTIYGTQLYTNGIPSGRQSVSTGKDRLEIGKNNSKKRKKENKENITSISAGAPACEEESFGFSSFSDEELIAWGEDREVDYTSAEDLSLFAAWEEEMQRRSKTKAWKGKAVEEYGVLTILKSHDEIMTECGLSKTLKGSLKAFLRHCYANKHLVTNDKLIGIIRRLQEDYGDDTSRCECINRAISGGFYDIKTGRDLWESQ